MIVKTRIELILLTAAALILSALSGCAMVKPVTPETGHYYINPNSDFSQIGKLVVFELENETRTKDLSLPLTEALAHSIQKRHLYSVRVLTEDDPKWADLNLNYPEHFSIEDMSAIRQKLDADAILTGRITEYYAYPRMLMGVHLRMVDLKNGAVVWGFEQVWDTTDKRTEERMRAYFDREIREGYEPYHWQLLITSPRAFQKFAVFEIARTLPESNGYFEVRPKYPTSYRGYHASSIDYLDFSTPMEPISKFSEFSPNRHKKH